LDSEVEVFRHTEAGWEPSNGGGGSGWFGPPFKRPGLGSRDVVGGHEHGSGGPEWSCCSVDASRARTPVWIEIIDAAGVERQPIESPFGAFIACSDRERPATVRILDADESVLATWSFAGIFAPDGVPGAFGGLAGFEQVPDVGDEVGLIQVSTRKATSEEMRQLLLHAAEGPSGLSPELREHVKSRLEGGDDPRVLAQWLMAVVRQADQEEAL
jgi:hypothetical protein